ncbi:MAG: signal recognition particle-docking protein FtsY [Syntrophaceae bacterium]|nr:signal recognition particle-docking protein FtsY [Syntrophaceae bacterium]
MGLFDRKNGFFDKLKSGLEKTKKLLLTDVDDLILGAKVIDQKLYDDIEEALIMADVGPTFAHELIERMQEQVKRKQLTQPELLKKVLRESMEEILVSGASPPVSVPAGSPLVIMVIGVNGTGKTTTIGKLARFYKGEGKEVLLVAADTFRAAAIEQLEVWASRTGSPLVKQQAGADPSAVVFDAMKAASSVRQPIVIIDTAGRLHTKVNLMEELKKMKRIMDRELSGAPHETYLVLDATTGQNAVSQAKLFHDEIGVSGIVLTKLDGTAKGGVVIRIARELKIPIRYIGVGEGLDDLRPFDAAEFVEALFD